MSDLYFWLGLYLTVNFFLCAWLNRRNDTFVTLFGLASGVALFLVFGPVFLAVGFLRSRK